MGYCGGCFYGTIIFAQLIILKEKEDTRMNKVIRMLISLPERFVMHEPFLFLCHNNQIIIVTLLAILLPWLSFIMRGKVLTGIICLLLQLTLLGWIPAAIWAVVSLNNARADRRTDRIVSAIKRQR